MVGQRDRLIGVVHQIVTIHRSLLIFQCSSSRTAHTIRHALLWKRPSVVGRSRSARHRNRGERAAGTSRCRSRNFIYHQVVVQRNLKAVLDGTLGTIRHGHLILAYTQSRQRGRLCHSHIARDSIIQSVFSFSTIREHVSTHKQSAAFHSHGHRTIVVGTGGRHCRERHLEGVRLRDGNRQRGDTSVGSHCRDDVLTCFQTCELCGSRIGCSVNKVGVRGDTSIRIIDNHLTITASETLHILVCIRVFGKYEAVGHIHPNHCGSRIAARVGSRHRHRRGGINHRTGGYALLYVGLRIQRRAEVRHCIGGILQVRHNVGTTVSIVATRLRHCPRACEVRRNGRVHIVLHGDHRGSRRLTTQTVFRHFEVQSIFTITGVGDIRNFLFVVHAIRMGGIEIERLASPMVVEARTSATVHVHLGVHHGLSGIRTENRHIGDGHHRQRIDIQLGAVLCETAVTVAGGHRVGGVGQRGSHNLSHVGGREARVRTPSVDNLTRIA